VASDVGVVSENTWRPIESNRESPNPVGSTSGRRLSGEPVAGRTDSVRESQIRQPQMKWDAPTRKNARQFLSMSVDGDLLSRPPMPILVT
jgi:hypothetical protein